MPLQRYEGLDCVRLTNDVVELLISVSAGPRILRYGFINGTNILGSAPGVSITTPAGTWRAYGGHRLWVAPESAERSHVPDENAVEYWVENARIATFCAPRDAAKIVRGMTVTMDADGSGVVITHRIMNAGEEPVRMAPWALTIMNGGGTAYIPHEPAHPHSVDFLPARPLVLWSYTDLTDPRWSLGPRFICVRSGSGMKSPQKIGVLNKQGWCGYFRSGDLFIKHFAYEQECTYPDFHVNNEVFSDGEFLELESLGCLRTFESGDEAVHVERWSLHAGLLVDSAEALMASF